MATSADLTFPHVPKISFRCASVTFGDRLRTLSTAGGRRGERPRGERESRRRPSRSRRSLRPRGERERERESVREYDEYDEYDDEYGEYDEYVDEYVRS